MCILWPYYTFYLLSFIKEFDKHYAKIILFGSVVVTCTLIVLLS